MAITTDTGAKKIENSENWRNIFGIHNDTVDAYDALAEQKDEEIGIVVKGNKTAHTGGAAAGQYIILRNSTITGCDDGLYTAAQAIPYDTAIDSTYLTPVSGGGLNALNASIMKLLWQNPSPNSSFANQTVQFDASGYTSFVCEFKRTTEANNETYTTVIAMINTSTTAAIPSGSSGVDEGTIYTLYRRLTISATGANFGTGQSFSANGHGTNNDYMIPTRIYGLY